MHINLQLLEFVYFVSTMHIKTPYMGAMLIMISYMADWLDKLCNSSGLWQYIVTTCFPCIHLHSQGVKRL
jgi:hypothetical protein